MADAPNACAVLQCNSEVAEIQQVISRIPNKTRRFQSSIRDAAWGCFLWFGANPRTRAHRDYPSAYPEPNSLLHTCSCPKTHTAISVSLFPITSHYRRAAGEGVSGFFASRHYLAQ
jgi:hypothetical protein